MSITTLQNIRYGTFAINGCTISRFEKRPDESFYEIQLLAIEKDLPPNGTKFEYLGRRFVVKGIQRLHVTSITHPIVVMVATEELNTAVKDSNNE